MVKLDVLKFYLMQLYMRLDGSFLVPFVLISSLDFHIKYSYRKRVY